MALPRALRKRLTPQEVKLWNWLRESVVPLGYHLRKQVAIERFVVDFACLRQQLVIEVDGEQHGRDPERQEADRRRDIRLGELGFRVLRFTNRDIDRHKDAVLNTIVAALDGTLENPTRSLRDHPPPPGEGSRGSVHEAG